MELQSLLLSRDASLVRLMKRALQTLEIQVLTCDSVDGALIALNGHTFQAIIVDMEAAQAQDLLARARQATDKKTIILAILSVNNTVREAFDKGANFVLYTPLTLDRTRHALLAMQSLMFAVQRRHFRMRLHTPVYLKLGRADEIEAVMLDLSEGGLALQGAGPLEAAQNIDVWFDLPGTRTVVQARGQVAWADQRGRVGIRFLNFSGDCCQRLQRWLSTATGGRAKPNS